LFGDVNDGAMDGRSEASAGEGELKSFAVGELRAALRAGDEAALARR
jgi:hypothetical protein